MKKESKFRKFWKEEAGDFGVKQIAATVAVIVLIGFAVGIIRGNMGEWVGNIWDMFVENIEAMIEE